MIDFLIDAFKNIVACLIVLGILSLPITLEYPAYYFNKANVNVYVDGNCIYSGPSHFVTVTSSEYNSTKEVRVYKDITKMVIVKKYISDNVKMVTVNEM